ncbi:alpha/beta fold hydrolase [Nocardia jinanensis]|uniref:O-methylpimelyl-ACP methylesterase n=1 Tax=Nocardia jinanensis TaxID=382504 RepID=A0A917RM95_9NOCA|nr:alpha/beta hydrolase [Nocardia jinanensis]GGL14400.1 O-methylpimelyl-ACP methylesterase [Nocardia jinanensis]
MSERLIEMRDGVRINVLALGTGRPVLLIHGWSLSSAVWDRQIRVLAESGHRVLAMDLRGHGGSEAPLGGYEIDSLAADAADVLAAFRVPQAAVVGWSLGGMVALRLAYDRPAMVERAVLVASNGVAASRTEAFPFGVPAEGPLNTILTAEHNDRVTLRRSAVGDPFKEKPATHLLDWLHRISLQTPSWAACAAMRTLLCTDQVHILDGVRVPVTQIIGTADPALSVRGARWLHERLATTLVEFDTGHYPMLEAADEFDIALLRAVGGGAG